MTRASDLVAATLLLSVLTVSPAAAQVQAGRTMIGFEIGKAGVDAGGFEADATRFNVRVGHPFSPPLEAELSLFGANAEDEPLPGITRRVKQLVLAGNVLYGFRPGETVSPYLLLGASMGTIEYEALGLSDDEFSLGLQGGAGCRFRIGEARRSAIRLELSLGYMQGVDWTTESEESHVTSVSIGLGYEHVLGGSKKEGASR